MPVYDAQCNECNTTYEFRGPSFKAPGRCLSCSSDDTKVVWLKGGFPGIDKAGDPYDQLDKRPPDSKPIKSFASDKRKGGKDTT